MKKKSTLSIYQCKTKRRRVQRPTIKSFKVSTPLKRTPQKKTLSFSSQNSKRKDVTPLSKTPKRCCKEIEWADLNTQNVIGGESWLIKCDKATQTDPSKPSIQSLEFDNDNLHEKKNEENILQILNEYGLKEDFLVFSELISDKKYPVDNIALVLFLETVRFYNCENTSQMWYSTLSKRFWKAGYKLFHTKFLYFMGWPKNLGDVLDGNSRGLCKPDNARINFAVPNINVLNKFSGCDLDLPKSVPCGVLSTLVSTLGSIKGAKYMLCADGKKVTAGIDKIGGDVDMFNFEDGETLSNRQSTLETEIQVFNEVLLDVKDGLSVRSTNASSEISVDKLKLCIKIIGTRIRSARELKKRQKYGLNKFLQLGGEKWRDSKYIYAISSLQASLYQIQEYLQSALSVCKRLCYCVSVMSQSIHEVTDASTIDISYQSNMVQLSTNTDDQVKRDSRFVKQRTDEWFQIREKACVTGSNIHNAIGLRGEKEQKIYIKKKATSEQDEVIDDAVKERMEHGCRNEIHALATLSSIAVPTFYPKCLYVEEGCYIVSGSSRSTLLVVSPDGSIRENADIENQVPVIGNAVAAVEVKCPFPNENVLPVHYSLPNYYVCQCLAEMFVLGTKSLVYLLYSAESSTVFEVLFYEELWGKIWETIVEIFDREQPLVTKKAKLLTKEIQGDIKRCTNTHVNFVAEIPSVRAIDSGFSQTTPDSYFLFAWPRVADVGHTLDVDAVNESLICSLKAAIDSNRVCYELLRRKATEVMVWVLTNIDRNSSIELPCSVPIVFGLKDYKLTSSAMRNATNFVIQKCIENGVQIVSFSTDGQWIQLMTRDINNNPMTVLQLQKNVWTKTQSLSKAYIADRLGKLNKVTDESGQILQDSIEIKKEGTAFHLKSRLIAFETVITCRDEKLWGPTKTSKKVHVTTAKETSQLVEHELGENCEIDTEWMPEEVIELVTDTSATSIETLALQQQERSNECEIEEDLHTSRLIENHECNDSLAESVRLPAEITKESINENIENEEGSLEADTGDGLFADTILNHDILEQTIDKMKELDKFQKKWASVTPETLYQQLVSASELTKFTHNELDIIYNSLQQSLPAFPIGRKSYNKSKKIELLKCLVANKVCEKPVQKRRKRPKNPPKLSNLCLKVVKSNKVPKAVLNVAYARYIFPEELKKWKDNSPFNSDTKVEGYEQDIDYWYSYPETNTSSGGLIGKSIDCSHNLTHLRVRSCTSGLGNISSDAWKACAKSNETRLNMSMVEDLLDKQNVPNARTNFSEEVESWMRRNDYTEAADITKIVRNWYEASDAPGMGAMERIGHFIEMRKFLLKDVVFGTFPPPGRYVNGIPIVTFEGMLIDIDTKIQLHGIVGPYNIRSVGSLAAETTVGILQSLNPSNSSSIKARDVPTLMSSVVELMSYTIRINSKRGFHMRTSRVSGVYPVHETEQIPESEIDELCIVKQSGAVTTILLRDHFFDKSERKKAKRKIRFETVSGPSAPARAAQPVRQWHKKDESKILPTKRLGIDIENLIQYPSA